jgi:ABC-2 type transport system permease protein
VNSLRVFFVGGITSYRALFHWMNPWIFIPMLIVFPVTQLLFFAYLGRSTGVADDAYFVVGNSLVAAALPGLFGIGHSLSGERRTQTLAPLLASPANRLALFLGRTLPAIANGFVVSAFCFAMGSLLLRFNVEASELPLLALTILVSACSCTALGVCVGSFGLRGRNVSVLSDLTFAFFLVAAGVNVPLSRLPDWLRFISERLPLTHGIKAARQVANGASFPDVSGLLATEAAVGAAYLVAGVLLIRLFEHQGRRSASLETF